MIEVGRTYSFGDTRFDDHLVFTVVKEAPHQQRDSASPGFLALILCGRHRGAPWMEWKGPGDTFTCATSSAVACDSVRFPREE